MKKFQPKGINMHPKGKIILHDMTPPTKAIDTENGRICIGCNTEQPLENFPKTKVARNPRCRTCINAKAREAKAAKNADTFRAF